MKNSNCAVLQTGNNASDHSHAKRATPMTTKLKELADYKFALGYRKNPETKSTGDDRKEPGKKAAA